MCGARRVVCWIMPIVGLAVLALSVTGAAGLLSGSINTNVTAGTKVNHSEKGLVALNVTVHPEKPVVSSSKNGWNPTIGSEYVRSNNINNYLNNKAWTQLSNGNYYSTVNSVITSSSTTTTKPPATKTTPMSSNKTLWSTLSTNKTLWNNFSTNKTLWNDFNKKPNYNKTIWANLTAIRQNLSSMFPPNKSNEFKQARGRESPSLLSSLLGWTSGLQKLGTSFVSKPNPLSPSASSSGSKWSWPADGFGKNSSHQEKAFNGLAEKYGGNMGSHYSPPFYGEVPPGSPYHANYGSYVGSPYAHKPYYPHEIPYGAYSSHHDGHYPASHEDEHVVYEKHHYHPPPLPPLPTDGALAPVYKPHAKVHVSADFVELKCSVYGDYLPYIRWVKLAGKNPHGHVLFTTIAEGSHVLYDSYHFAVRSDGRSSRLIIRDPDPHVHYGTYQCQVMVAGDYNHIAKDDFVVGRFY